MTNINIFGDAVSHKGLVELYREAYGELESDFPHFTGHLALYFDNDPRELQEVLNGYFPEPEMVEAFLPRLEEAMASNRSSLVGTFAGDDGNIEGTIIIRGVEEGFDPAKQEEAMWGRLARLSSFPRPDPPLDYPEGFHFWSDFYHELGNHLHAVQNIEDYKAGTVSGLEKEMYADTFATFAMYKRFGDPVLPFMKHFANVRTLEVAMKGSQDYYTTPAINEAMERIMGKRKKFADMSLGELEAQAIPIVKKTMRTNKDVKAFAQGVPALDDPAVGAVLMMDPDRGTELLRSVGLNNYAIKYKRAINDIMALHTGGEPYKAFDQS